MLDSQSFVRFLMQLGLAITGATSLWSFVLYYLARKSKDKMRAENLWKLANLPFPLFVAGVLLFVGSWVLLENIFSPALSSAHEGIAVKATEDYIRNGLAATAPFVSLLIFCVLFIAWVRRARKKFFKKYNILLFGLCFALVSVIASLILFVDSFNTLQIFYFLHHWHSIFTLGTVIVVDYFFFRTAKHQPIKAVLYPLFPLFSIVIWSGLGIDFLSNLLIFEEAFTVNSKFLFVQTVIAIIILNGTLLSQRINDKLIKSVELTNPLPVSQKMQNVFGFSGSVSIISWLTITFVDVFTFNLKYWQFSAYYLLAIIFAFVIHLLMRKRLDVFQVHKTAQ
ncbi:MAG: hypothetical protein HYS15_02320 [Candidatus Spechtbacteria bacterium]|nr:hypothetical protein [Candidatus Spechtbacteria bacterium]